MKLSQKASSLRNEEGTDSELAEFLLERAKGLIETAEAFAPEPAVRVEKLKAQQENPAPPNYDVTLNP